MAYKYGRQRQSLPSFLKKETILSLKKCSTILVLQTNWRHSVETVRITSFIVHPTQPHIDKWVQHSLTYQRWLFWSCIASIQLKSKGNFFITSLKKKRLPYPLSMNYRWLSLKSPNSRNAVTFVHDWNKAKVTITAPALFCFCFSSNAHDCICLIFLTRCKKSKRKFEIAEFHTFSESIQDLWSISLNGLSLPGYPTFSN